MEFVSTRDPSRRVSLSVAIRQGIAPGGGLYVPERLPKFIPGEFDNATTLQAVAGRLLAPFFEGDALVTSLAEIVADAFNFPAPLKPLRAAPQAVSVLELFHGPTAAFKDFGARFLAACLERLPREKGRPVTILVATSGDTGGAVAAAFHRRPWARVVILYPKGLVSPRQERQLTCWDDNVHTVAIAGTFDDCQRLVKEAFADIALVQAHNLSSANSINIGRLLPQAVYYAASSLELFRRDGRAPSFIIPSGNLGNAMACIWAREMGLPIDRIELAHNANFTVPEFMASGEWLPRPSVATLASAMDVGNPSNMERMRHLFPEWSELRQQVHAHVVSDDQIRARIREDAPRWQETWCPHTATAAEVYARLGDDERSAAHWVLVATAHPAKFNEIVEPLIGTAVPVPAALATLLELPNHADELSADLGRFRTYLRGL